MWGRLYQYTEDDGQRGWNGDVNMNGYKYNFIFVGEGDTSLLEQDMLNEVIDMLKTIQW